MSSFLYLCSRAGLVSAVQMACRIARWSAFDKACCCV